MPKKRKTRTKTQGPKPKPKLSRRSLLQNSALFGVGAIALAGAAYWAFGSFQGALSEQDLSVIGNGEPAIVQVHDRDCQLCESLQIEVRAALATLGAGDLTYRVAYLDTGPGMDFATKHGASFATLLFFDGQGNMVRKMQGANDRNTLQAEFTSHSAAN
jgi:hypothetical protein